MKGKKKKKTYSGVRVVPPCVYDHALQATEFPCASWCNRGEAERIIALLASSGCGSGDCAGWIPAVPILLPDHSTTLRPYLQLLGAGNCNQEIRAE